VVDGDGVRGAAAGGGPVPRLPRFEPGELLPVVIQDATDGRVLTVAWTNEEAYARSLATGQTWLYSRSRAALWHKGETSGNTQQIVSMEVDCDADALLYRVIPHGPACHTGDRSCFDGVSASPPEAGELAGHGRAAPPARADGAEVIAALEARIAERDRERIQGSYTAYLLEQGLDKILKKVGEEATEVVVAAKNDVRQPLVSEMADLIYHLLVLARATAVSWQDLCSELDTRCGPEDRAPRAPKPQKPGR